MQPPIKLQQHPLGDQQSKEDPKLKVPLIDRSTIHICKAQPLLIMKGSPLLKLLTPAHIVDKKDVTPDSQLRQKAFPAPPINLLNLLNMKVD